MTWRIGSLFAGVAGLDLGLHAAGVGTTAWFSEVDRDASTVLAARFPGVPNLGDVRAVDWRAVEPVDVLVGGYPCQPFSYAGLRGGADDERHLWPAFADALRLLRPRYAVLENVSGHLSLGFDAVLADLAEAGFDAVWTTLRASDVGAPHRRERLFVVAGNAAGPRADSFAEGRPSWCRPLQSGDVVAADAEDGRGRWDRRPQRFEWCCDRAIPVDADDQGPQGRDALRCGGGERTAGTGGVGVAADAASIGVREPDDETDALSDEWASRLISGSGGGRVVQWGAYAAAIARWEHALGRAAPAPVDERGRLNAAFSEWMMGFPEGWVTDVLPRNPALRCIGNAVVPQVAAVVGVWLLRVAAESAPL